MRETTLAHKIRHAIAKKFPAAMDFDILDLKMIIERHQAENEELARLKKEREEKLKLNKQIK